jgi:hypothetical protein
MVVYRIMRRKRFVLKEIGEGVGKMQRQPLGVVPPTISRRIQALKTIPQGLKPHI